MILLIKKNSTEIFEITKTYNDYGSLSECEILQPRWYLMQPRFDAYGLSASDILENTNSMYYILIDMINVDQHVYHGIKQTVTSYIRKQNLKSLM